MGVGAAGGAVAALLGLPVPWLIGPMLAGLAVKLRLRWELRVPVLLLSAAQVTVGLAVGLSFSVQTLIDLGVYLPAVLGVLLATTALSLANGYLLARWTGIDPSSGLLGCIPGAASAMVAAADRVGADPRTVAVLQYVRLLLILAVVPAAAAAWAGSPGDGVDWPHDGTRGSELLAEEGGAGGQGDGAGWLIQGALIALMGAGGAYLARRARLASPNVLGPMLAATAAKAALGFAPALPGPVFNAAVGVIGLSVGLRFDGPTLRALRRVVAVETALLLGLLLGSALLAYGLHLLTGIDVLTAMLGNVPGALEAIVAAAVELGAQVPIVAAMQTVRSVALLCLGPLIVSALRAPARAPKRATPSR